jgi:tetratricopeptide (TPR) repeat protein
MKLSKDFTQKYLEANIESHLQRCSELISSNSLKNVHYHLTQALLMCKSLHSSNEKRLSLQTRTLTTLGHFHKLSGNLSEAIRYYEEALSLQSTGLTQISLHLHLSSVLSSSNQHESALRHALKSLGLLKRASICSQEYLESTVIAFYNIAVEYEFLKEHQQAEECYLKGYRFALSHLGRSHSLTVQIKNSINDLLASRPKLGLNLTRLKESSTASASSRRRSSSLTSRNSSVSVKVKSIDVEILRKIEHRAAVFIQKVWRGHWTRRHLVEVIIQTRLSRAAVEAQFAIEKYEKEKRKIQLVKKNFENSLVGQGVRPVRALMSIKKFKEIFE